MAQSSIEWTEATWNPVTGCDKISPGCKHCYAEVMARRLQAMGQPNYRHGFELTLFFKQWGGRNKKKAGRQLGGRTWDEMPGAGRWPRRGVGSPS